MTILRAVQDAVDETANAFRRESHRFFTESDVHHHLRRSLASRFPDECLRGRSFPLIHSEYPTWFRFKPSNMKGYFPLQRKKAGDRGHYDIVILDRDFVRDALTWAAVRARTIPDAKANPVQQLLLALELKLIAVDGEAPVKLVENDLKKLEWAIESEQAANAMAVVFCYADHKCLPGLRRITARGGNVGIRLVVAERPTRNRRSGCGRSSVRDRRNDFDHARSLRRPPS